MKSQSRGISVVLGMLLAGVVIAEPLGLPPLPIPADNPQTPAKIELGDKLFHDQRFSSTGKVSCATCHVREKVFTDGPLKVSEGINKLTGTRNAPTVVNAAYMHTLFWDGREPDLEGQAGQPFLNPVEMALKDYKPILSVVRDDPDYQPRFKEVFDVSGDGITIEHVKQAIAAFERTLISGDSPFDRWYFGRDPKAMSDAAVRGFEVYMGQGRCVSCHTIAEDHALFTDNRFHNLNVGFERIAGRLPELTAAFEKSKREGGNVDVAVLSNANLSELGRYAVDDEWRSMGAFKTPTLRNVAKTAPYMHDGSLETLDDVVSFYNKGGRVKDKDPINAYQSSGIRPLDLTDEQQADLVAFLEALTSPAYAKSK